MFYKLLMKSVACMIVLAASCVVHAMEPARKPVSENRIRELVAAYAELRRSSDFGKQSGSIIRQAVKKSPMAVTDSRAVVYCAQKLYFVNRLLGEVTVAYSFPIQEEVWQLITNESMDRLAVRFYRVQDRVASAVVGVSLLRNNSTWSELRELASKEPFQKVEFDRAGNLCTFDAHNQWITWDCLSSAHELPVDSYSSS